MQPLQVLHLQGDSQPLDDGTQHLQQLGDPLPLHLVVDHSQEDRAHGGSDEGSEIKKQDLVALFK